MKANSDFVETSFEAEFRGAKINAIGGVDMLIRIPPKHRREALELAETAETMVQMDVKRLA